MNYDEDQLSTLYAKLDAVEHELKTLRGGNSGSQRPLQHRDPLPEKAYRADEGGGTKSRRGRTERQGCS
jgi:hypothetical protein